MQKEIIQFYQQLGNKKIKFIPEIRISTGAIHPVWIDELYPVKDSLYVTVSTNDDNYKKSIENLTEVEEKALHQRLTWMTKQKKENKAA